MDFGGIPLFSIMKTKLSFMSERQGVLAQNVANADTPGYRARDIKAPDFKAMVMNAGGGGAHKLHMETSRSGHMLPASGPKGSFETYHRPATDELNPNGNNVSIEEEMAKVAENQAEYTKVLNLYGKMIAMFRLAAGKPTG